MPSRREFIQVGLVAPAFAVRPLSASAPGEPHRPFKVVFDHNFAEGAAFGAEAILRGAPAIAIGNNAGSVWMNEIEPQWKRGPAVIAGLTGRSSLFCLELLARDYGMGLVYRAEHRPTAGGGIRHIVTGPECISALERRLAAAGQRWSAVAARMVMDCPATLEPDPRIGLLDLAQPPGIAKPSLFSWVIGPGRRPGVLGEKRKRG